MTTIGIIGADTTGGELAQWASMCGFNVKIYDSSTKALSNNRQQVISKLQQKVDIEQISMSEAQEIVKRITPVLGISGLADCELIIDCAPQDIKIKRAIFSELSEISTPEAVLATSSPCLSVTSVASNLKRARQIVGMHFFTPIQGTDLVEVVAGLLSSQETIEKACSFARKMMKTAIVCKDTPGYISNRIQMLIFNELVDMIASSDLSVTELDLATQYWGIEPGLAQRLDIHGLDRALYFSNIIHQSMYHNPRYMPSIKLKMFVDAGFTGLNKQIGLIDYKDAELVAKLHAKPTDIHANEGLKLLYLMINEACYLAQEGIADEENIDKVCKLGLLLPKGPFELANELGWQKVYDAITEFYSFTLNPRFRPAVYLKRKIVKN